MRRRPSAKRVGLQRIKTVVTRVASRHLAARASFDVDFIQRLRKEFLLLMKNTDVVHDYAQAQRWRAAMATWRGRFDDLIYKRLASAISDIPLQYEWISRDETKRWEKYVRKETWSLYIDASVPIDRADDYWSEDARFSQFQRELPTWERRVKRSARKAWKALKDFVFWYRNVTRQDPSIDLPLDEQVRLEGFQVLVKDYDPSFDLNPDFVERFKAGLRQYRERAQAVLPLLLQRQLPLVLDFKADLDEGGSHHGSFITINPSASRENPGRMAQILAHEMGHHLWQGYLSKDAQEFWRRAISGNYGTLDLHDVLRRYGDEIDFWQNKRILREDPLLYLQIDGLYTSEKETFAPRTGKAIFSMPDVRSYLERGGQSVFHVHGKPITGYAHKNAEEAFCEALGMLVGYGPQTVLPEVRSWLKTLLPQIKIAHPV